MHDPECAAVRAWFDAFNRGDGAGMQRLLAPDARVEAPTTPPRSLEVLEVRKVRPGRVLMLGRSGDGLDFAALHSFDDEGRITAVHHYLSDGEALDGLDVLNQR